MRCNSHLLEVEVGVEMEWAEGWVEEGVKAEILTIYAQGCVL